jgi:hypothetical protein
LESELKINKFGELKVQKVIYATCLSCLLSTSVLAGETSHYVPGVEGIKAASIPPPGSYSRTYFSFYHADTLMNENGDELDVDFDIDVLALSERLIWVSDKESWGGGRLAADMVIPFVSTDLSIGAFGVDEKDSGMADIFIEPFILTWNEPRYDFAFGGGLYMPTGSYDKLNSASVGKDFWTLMLTVGGTHYFDISRSWAASILARYEINSEKDETAVTPGDNFSFEWGISNAINPAWEVGLTGYASWQVSDDKGSDVTWDPSIHDQVYAIGPEISTFIPDMSLIFSLRALWEFGAEDRSEGSMMTMTLTKIF